MNDLISFSRISTLPPKHVANLGWRRMAENDQSGVLAVRRMTRTNDIDVFLWFVLIGSQGDTYSEFARSPEKRKTKVMYGNGKKLCVAIGGFGAIGRKVGASLDEGIPGLELVAVSARNTSRAQGYMREHFSRVYDVLALDGLAEVADVVVECCPAAHFRRIAEPTLRAGKLLVAISVGAIIDNQDLVELARTSGGRILVPSGALLGLDAVQATAQGEIRNVKMVTQKPVPGLQGAPFLEERGIDLTGIRKPLKVFEGTATEAISGFPANLNVAVALGYAGVGPDKTHLEIWANPGVDRNTHTITVDSDSAFLTMKIENIPSIENPKTGKITPLSIVSSLKRLTAPLVIGA